jgi:hypothetical protein
MQHISLDLFNFSNFQQTRESSSTDDNVTQDLGAFDSSWAPTPRPKNVELQSLNSFLIQSGRSSVDGQLRRPLEEASDSTVRYYRRKAKEAFGLVLHCLAPGQEDELMKITVGEKAADLSQSDQDVDSSTSSLVVCYQAADNWCTKRQILSILAHNMTKQRLMVRYYLNFLLCYLIRFVKDYIQKVYKSLPPYCIVVLFVIDCIFLET